ncbi:MAG: VOC family protein [Aureispira sp.]|nr:VOC family protein [Aureispira sp.]
MENPTSEKKVWSQWFEIPVTDMSLAKKFYETVMDTTLEVNNFGGFEMAIFPHSTVGCALCIGEGYEPSTKGVTVYINANPNLETILGRIEAAGGQIVLPKTEISPEHGYMALFIDTEGNRLALHSDPE